VYFVTNAISHLLPALGARLLTEGMPMHLLRDATLRRSADGSIQLRLDPGSGSAPDAEATLRPASGPAELPQSWLEYWPNYRDFLSYCVPQDRALATQPLSHRTTRQEIQLGILLDVCQPLTGEVGSAAARALVGDAEPVCFRVPALTFRFDGEHYDEWR
jgi:hypothetical protein